MAIIIDELHAQPKSRPSRGAWIEIRSSPACRKSRKSRPSRGAWIEIDLVNSSTSEIAVAPLAGRVD